MLAPTILSVCSILYLTAGESIELESIYSVDRFSGAGRDFYFLCTLCGGVLYWSINEDSKGGFTSSSPLGTVRINGMSGDIIYFSTLLEKTTNGNTVCMTSLMLAHYDEISGVSCFSENERVNLTTFSTVSTYNHKNTSRVNVDYVSVDKTVLSEWFNYTYIFQCEVQGEESLSLYVNDILVQKFTSESTLERHNLMPQDKNMFTHAILFSNHHFPENYLTAILLVSVVDSSNNFHVLCQAGENEEEMVDFTLPSQDSTTMNVANEVFSSGRPSPTEDSSTSIDNTPKTSKFNSTTVPPNGGISNTKVIAGVCVGVGCMILFIVVILALVAIYKRKLIRSGEIRLPEADDDKEEVDGPVVSSSAETEKDETSSEIIRGMFVRKRRK